ncbi:hypothetical protein INR49_011529 [Caranx melampygus]|nr:hypothetical protein INR49_011529 [Caranx melampygus]
MFYFPRFQTIDSEGSFCWRFLEVEVRGRSVNRNKSFSPQQQTSVSPPDSVCFFVESKVNSLNRKKRRGREEQLLTHTSLCVLCVSFTLSVLYTVGKIIHRCKQTSRAPLSNLNRLLITSHDAFTVFLQLMINLSLMLERAESQFKTVNHHLSHDFRS